MVGERFEVWGAAKKAVATYCQQASQLLQRTLVATFYILQKGIQACVAVFVNEAGYALA